MVEWEVLLNEWILFVVERIFIMIKLIASDIDGTLVKDGTLAIDPEYMDVIERLIDKGIVFVACSGRQYRSERKLFAPVADRLLYITDGGTVVRTPKETLKVDTMPDEIWKGMLSMVHESLPSCDYYIATPDRGFAEDGGSRMFHWLRDSYGYDIQEISDARILDDQQIIKFSVYHPNACEELCAPVFTPAWKDKVTLVSAGKEWMDATLQGSGKGPALAFLQKYLGIAPDETCAFGDNINDIEMLREAGFSYAVSNSRPEVQAAAKDTCPPYWENGVLQVLKTFL